MPKDPKDFQQLGREILAARHGKRPALRGNEQRVRKAERAREERRKPEFTQKQVVRLAARLWKLGQEPGTPPGTKKEIRGTLRKALAGYGHGERVEEKFDLTGQRGLRWAQKYGVPQTELIELFREVQPPYKTPSANPVGTAMEYLARPAEAVQGAIYEGAPTGPGAYFKPWEYDVGDALEGAKKGITGEKKYEGLEVAARAQGMTKRQARKMAEDVPEPFKTVADIGVDVVTDPLTYLSFGTSAGAKAATRSAAATIAEETGGRVPEIITRLANRGVRGLSAAEREVLEREAPALLGPLRGARGGVKVLGTSIPGTNRLRALTTPAKQHVWSDAEKGPLAWLARKERLLSPRGGLRQLERAGRAEPGTVAAIDAARAQYQSWRSLAERRINQLLHADKGLDDEARDAILRAIDVGPGAIDDLPPELAGKARVIDRVRRELTDAEIDVGLLHPERMEIPPEQYAPRYLTPEGAAERGRRAEQRVMAGEGAPDVIGGPYRGGMSAKRFGRKAETKLTPQAELRTEAGDPVFDPNPFRAMARRGAESARDVARVKFVDQVMDLRLADGTPVLREWDEALDPAMWREVEVPVGMIDDAGERVVSKTPMPMAVRREVADDFERVVKLMYDDNELHHFLKGLDKWMGLWKSYATSPVPFGFGFTIRNMEGNFFNGYYLTGTNPGWAYRAMKLQRKMWRGRREFADPLHFLNDVERAQVTEAFDNGVLESGFFEADLDEAFDLGKFGGKTKGRLNPFSQEFAPLEYGRRFNTAVEQNGRLGVFLGQRAKGLRPQDAAAMVRKYLLDYGDLTDFDRSMKKFAPFWTFTRKNTPLQVEHLVKTPGRYSNLQHVLDSMGSDYETEDLPEWMQDSGAVVLPGGEPRQVWVPDLPPFAAGEALAPLSPEYLGPLLRREPGALEEEARAIYNAVGIGGPVGVFKALGEIGAGGQIFSGRKFRPGEQVATPAYLAPLRPLGVDTIPYEWQFLLEQLAPATTKVRGALPTDESDQDKQRARLTSMFLGQQIRELGEPTKGAARWEDLRKLLALQEALRSRGFELPESSATSQTVKKKRLVKKGQPIDWKALG